MEERLPPLRSWDDVRNDPVSFPPRLPVSGRVQCCELDPPNNYVNFSDCHSRWFQVSPANEWLLPPGSGGGA